MSTRDRSIAILFAVALLSGAAGAAPAPAPTAATAATVDAKLAEARGAVYARKTASLKAVMRLDAAQQAAFDPLLAAYDAELKALGDRRLALIKEYASFYNSRSLDDKNAKRLVMETIKVKQDQLALFKKTFDKAAKAIGVTKAAEFIQVENAFAAAVDTKLALEMPRVGSAMKQ